MDKFEQKARLIYIFTTKTIIKRGCMIFLCFYSFLVMQGLSGLGLWAQVRKHSSRRRKKKTNAFKVGRRTATESQHESIQAIETWLYPVLSTIMKLKKSAYSDSAQKSYVLKFPEKVRGRRTTYYKIHHVVLNISSALFVTTHAFEVDERS